MTTRQPLIISLLKFLVFAVFVFFFVFFIFQYNNMEKRIIDLQTSVDQMKSDLAVARDIMGRLPALGGTIATHPGSGAPAQPARKYLHPEVDNFLQPDPFNYVCEEAVAKGKLNGTLVRRWGSDPKGFNIVLENEATLSRKLYALCQGFAAFPHWNDPGKYAPRLAERIEITNDYKTYTFYFRPGVRWHRPVLDWGNPRYDWLKGDHYITARDFAFYLDMVRHPQVEAGHLKNYYAKIKDYTVIDDYTMVVNWTEKQYQSRSAMTDMFRPLPVFIYAYDEDGKEIPAENLGIAFNNHWFNHNYISCGPYRFVSYEPGVKIEIERNEFFYGPKPNIKRIVNLIYRDRKQVLLKIKSKEQDFAERIAHEYVVEEKKNPKSPFADGRVKVLRVPIVGYTYIGWNAETPLFSDKRVRRAMTHALDRETILKNVVYDLGTIVTGPFFVKSPDYNSSIKPYRFDMAQAEALLEACGWRDTDGDGVRDKTVNGEKINFEFTLLVWNTSPQWQTIAKIYKETLYQLGITMNIRPLDWAVFLKKMNNKEFDAYTGYWVTNYESDPYQIWHSSQADVPRGSNRVGFRNQRADAIIEEARRTFDPVKRAELFHEFHAIVHEEQPYTFCFAPIEEAVHWEKVKNVILRKERPHTLSFPYYIDE